MMFAPHFYTPWSGKFSGNKKQLHWLFYGDFWRVVCFTLLPSLCKMFSHSFHNGRILHFFYVKNVLSLRRISQLYERKKAIAFWCYTSSDSDMSKHVLVCLTFKDRNVFLCIFATFFRDFIRNFHSNCTNFLIALIFVFVWFF